MTLKIVKLNKNNLSDLFTTVTSETSSFTLLSSILGYSFTELSIEYSGEPTGVEKYVFKNKSQVMGFLNIGPLDISVKNIPFSRIQRLK